MKPKKRLTRKDPGYYVPLPYAMAIKKVAPDFVFEEKLFSGMQLEFVIEGVINKNIAVVACLKDNDEILGYIPGGMITRVEGLIEHEDRLVVSLERKSCNRLKNVFWICIDELPDLPDFTSV